MGLEETIRVLIKLTHVNSGLSKGNLKSREIILHIQESDTDSLITFPNLLLAEINSPFRVSQEDASTLPESQGQLIIKFQKIASIK